MAQNLYIDGTEMSAGDNAWPNILAKQFETFVNFAEPFKSSERILQSLFEYIETLGEYDQPSTDAEIRRHVYVVEFPNPYNQTLWVPEYGTYVNVCGDTGERWIADEELRANPTPHFLELIGEKKEKICLLWLKKNFVDQIKQIVQD